MSCYLLSWHQFGKNRETKLKTKIQETNYYHKNNSYIHKSDSVLVFVPASSASCFLCLRRSSVSLPFIAPPSTAGETMGNFCKHAAVNSHLRRINIWIDYSIHSWWTDIICNSNGTNYIVDCWPVKTSLLPYIEAFLLFYKYQHY